MVSEVINVRIPVYVKKLPSRTVAFGGRMKSKVMSGSPAPPVMEEDITASSTKNKTPGQDSRPWMQNLQLCALAFEVVAEGSDSLCIYSRVSWGLKPCFCAANTGRSGIKLKDITRTLCYSSLYSFILKNNLHARPALII